MYNTRVLSIFVIVTAITVQLQSCDAAFGDRMTKPTKSNSIKTSSKSSLIMSNVTSAVKLQKKSTYRASLASTGSHASFHYATPPVSPYDQNGVVLLSSLREPDLAVSGHPYQSSSPVLPVYNDHGPASIAHQSQPHENVVVYDAPTYNDQGPNGHQSAGYSPPIAYSPRTPTVTYDTPPPTEIAPVEYHPAPPSVHLHAAPQYSEQAEHHSLPPPPPSTYPSPTEDTQEPSNYNQHAPPPTPPYSQSPFVIPVPTPLSALFGPRPELPVPKPSPTPSGVQLHAIPFVSYTEPQPDYNDYNSVELSSESNELYTPGVPGIGWRDYPMYASVPITGFDCRLTKYPGFYADIDSGCQVS